MTRKPEPQGQVTARVAKARATRKAKGMIRFDKWVTPQQLEAIKAMLDQWESNE